MGLFNSLKNQHERLVHAMDDHKTLTLGTAASVMRVNRSKVDAVLSRMYKKGYFGSDRPYVDDALELVVRDKRYATLAALLYASDTLLRTIDQAQQNLKRVRRPTSRQIRDERVRSVGNFVRDAVSSAFKNEDSAAYLRNRTGELMRDLISPTLPDPSAALRPMSQTLSLLYSSAAGLKDFALAHPDMPYDTELVTFVQAANRQAEAWNGCGIQSNAYSPETDPRLQEMEQRLYNEFAMGLMHRLDEMHSAAANGRTAPAAYDDPVLQEVAQRCSDIRILSRQPVSTSIRNAMARVNAILDDILTQLHTVPKSREMAGARSLRVCYLPMLEELLEKYIHYEKRMQSSETSRAMQDTEKALSVDLPTALLQLLQDLRTEDAIDLEAQTVALRQKMHLDGLLKDDHLS
ncbi:MAG: hypothetical protein IKW00_08805 [Clostridia bacterium]|nr:hypothetical protein [Clostridia bacterium]